MTDLLPAETGASAAPQPPARHWKEAAAEGRAGRTGRIAREVEDCLGVAEMSASEVRADRRLGVAAALADLTPGDEVEGQLTAQLLMVHGMAMDCVRATRDTLKAERVRLAYLTHAARMVSLYARHVGKLEQRRDEAGRRARAKSARTEDALIAAALSCTLDRFRAGASVAPGDDVEAA